MQDLLQRHIAVVRLNDLSLGLNSADDSSYLCQLLFRHLCRFVEQDNITELYLLRYQRSQVLFFIHDLGAVSVAQLLHELVSQTQCIHHRADAIQLGNAIGGKLRYHLRIRHDSLCYRCRFADSRCFYHDIVKSRLTAFALTHTDQIMQLSHQIHLQRTAYTAVLKSH